MLCLSLIAAELSSESSPQLIPSDQKFSIANSLIEPISSIDRTDLKKQSKSAKPQNRKMLFWKSTPRKLTWDFPIPSPARRAKRVHTHAKGNSRRRRLDGPDSKRAFPFIWKPLKIKNSKVSDTVIKPYIEPENAAQGITLVPNEIAAQEQNIGPTIKAENNLRLKRQVL